MYGVRFPEFIPTITDYLQLIQSNCGCDDKAGRIVVAVNLP